MKITCFSLVVVIELVSDVLEMVVHPKERDPHELDVEMLEVELDVVLVVVCPSVMYTPTNATAIKRITITSAKERVMALVKMHLPGFLREN